MRSLRLVTRRARTALAIAVVVVMAASPGAAGSTEGVAGLLGLRPADEGCCIAVWLPVPKGKALVGVEWFNNDMQVIFPEARAACGTPGSPVSLAQADVVATGIRGESSSWSEFDLDEPIVTTADGIYLILRFPPGSSYTADGGGGGAAIGYTSDGTGYSGWISPDGNSWVGFSDENGFAVRPRFVDDDGSGVLVKNAGNGQPEVADLSDNVLSLNAAPNPFNPETAIRFNLPSPSQVEIVLYDIRGSHVRTVARGEFGAGPHEVRWAGRDEQGRRVASGVYLAILRTPAAVMRHRLVLVQ